MDEKEGREMREMNLQHLLFRITHQYVSVSFAQAAKMGIHPGQMPILGFLAEHDGVTQKEISKKLNVKPSTITVSIQRLEKMELARKVQDEKDQRMMRVYLTEQGKEVVVQMKKLLQENEKILLAGFSETEVCLLRRMLSQVEDNLKKVPDNKMLWCGCEEKENQRC